ncbi:hypothetical protein EVAR_14492_1 [Eumeta japonica]|uniref:Uncharacterized protein n=1 Tax=Eumeta variegata TaxID=151549 RepID=A0A4C1U4L2_EUMVA|nr:hypothetical protein EVAR_14492_1 [Eumeta japonica]
MSFPGTQTISILSSGGLSVERVPYPQGKKRDPITKTPLSVRPSVTRLYLMNRDNQIVEIFTDDLFLLPL